MTRSAEGTKKLLHSEAYMVGLMSSAAALNSAAIKSSVMKYPTLPLMMKIGAIPLAINMIDHGIRFKDASGFGIVGFHVA